MGKQVRLIGEVNDRAKQGFLANAAALLFPIDWPEPFGLVMIEAMACGTPVIAFRSGSLPEVVDDGITVSLFPTNRKPSKLWDASVNSIVLAYELSLKSGFPLDGWRKTISVTTER
ncbi:MULTISPECIES: glycosyltransferase [Bradyrhizobium]|jgi:glycosyltransferase involved in cell wall biosynthesis|uniref:glycosyltransferase n=1 Tax=Bradyrhizobium TaxID=374 RepID=UPI0026AC78DB